MAPQTPGVAARCVWREMLWGIADSAQAMRVRVLFDFEAKEENELPLRVGENIIVIDNR